MHLRGTFSAVVLALNTSPSAYLCTAEMGFFAVGFFWSKLEPQPLS